MNEEKIWVSDSGNYYEDHLFHQHQSSNSLDNRIEELENKVDKIIEFLNKFLDTNIKT